MQSEEYKRGFRAGYVKALLEVATSRDNSRAPRLDPESVERRLDPESVERRLAELERRTFGLVRLGG